MSLRTIGIASADRSKILEFVDHTRRVGASLELLTDGADQPIAAIARDRSAYPTISFERRGGHLMCVFDGELFALGESGEGLASNPARAVLDGYATDGTSVLGDMDANAAVAILDGRAKQVTFARDRIGNGSAFSPRRADTLYWSSSLTALRQLLGGAQVNTDALDYYISAGYVPSPWTLFAGIERLGPGEFVQWNGCRLAHERYYRLYPEEPEGADQTQVQLLAQELPRAVRRRIRNINETGVLLSGGVDSMLLLAVIAKECGTAPRSFTFRYERYEGTLNESPRAKRCAAHVGSQHEDLAVDPLLIPSHLPELFEAFGEPFSLGLHTAMLGALADRGVADLLTGSGADSGNLDGQSLNAVRFTGLPAGMRAVLAGGSQALQILDESWRARHQGRPLPFVGPLSSALAGGIWTARTKLPWITSSWAMPPGLRRRIYRVPSTAANAQAARNGLLAKETEEAKGKTLELGVAINDSRFFDGDLMQMWNLHSGRAHGLAIRTPFLSFPLLSRRLSYDLAEGGKEATRQFAATLLPEDLARAPKNYQAVPISEWLRGPLLPFVRERLEPATFGRSGLFDTKFVGRLLDAHVNGKVDLGWALWMLAQVSLWLDVTGA